MKRLSGDTKRKEEEIAPRGQKVTPGKDKGLVFFGFIRVVFAQAWLFAYHAPQVNVKTVLGRSFTNLRSPAIISSVAQISIGGLTMKIVMLSAVLTSLVLVGAAQAQAQEKFPWQFNKEYVFNFAQGGTSLGTEIATIKKVKQDGKDAYELKAVLNLTVGGQSLKSTATLVTTPDGKPLKFVRDFQTQGAKVESTFKGGKVSSKVSGSVNVTKEDDLPANAFCFDNNMMSAFMLICPQLKWEVGKKVVTENFIPSVLQKMKLTYDVTGLKKIKVGGKDVECYECSIAEIKATFWVAKDGRIVKTQQGAITTEIKSLD